MARKTSSCTVCENANLASICSVCANYRLDEYGATVMSLKNGRDSLYSRLSEVLVGKGKADGQLSWRVLQNDKLTRLREKLRLKKEEYSQGMPCTVVHNFFYCWLIPLCRKATIEKMSLDLKIKYELLESAMSTRERNRGEQLEKYYPNLICTQSLGHRVSKAFAWVSAGALGI